VGVPDFYQIAKRLTLFFGGHAHQTSTSNRTTYQQKYSEAPRSSTDQMNSYVKSAEQESKSTVPQIKMASPSFH
jgi:hypothetical protein